MKVFLILAVMALLCACCPAMATITVPAGTGAAPTSDGILNPTESVVIDLSQAPTGVWDQDNTANAGKGVYDPDKWAVVFKYSSVNIPAGVIVSFSNHPSGAPVVWLVQGDVVIAGTISLDGCDKPGPGGFRPDLGPGALSGPDGIVGLYGPTYYGNERILPLIGGSGGQFKCGGGAILAAATGGIWLQGIGCINANSCAASYRWQGSGGGIRLISDSVQIDPEAELSAVGWTCCWGTWETGRIRVETNSIVPDAVPGHPPASMAQPGSTAQLWPEDTAPSIRCVSLGGVPVPSDPRSRLSTPINADLYIADVGTKTLLIQAENVPTTWHVRARVAGALPPIEAILTAGDSSNSTWEAQIPLAVGLSAIQVRASVD